MDYYIDAELLSSKFNSALKVKIISGNNKTLVTNIPYQNNEKVTFTSEEEVSVSYYHGEFVYSFSLLFNEEIASDDHQYYEFLIEEVHIENNYRKTKREIVEYQGLIMIPKDIIYTTVLDISDTGLKFETSKPIGKSKIELHYANDKNETIKIKGKIVWSKKINEKKYQYGLKRKN